MNCNSRGKQLFLPATSIVCVILGLTLCTQRPIAYAQRQQNPQPQNIQIARVVDANASSRRQPKLSLRPSREPAIPGLIEVDDTIVLKQHFLDKTQAGIDEQLEVRSQCQLNIDDLTHGVAGDGLEDLGKNIRQVKPRIRGLQGVMDNAERRIVLLKLQEELLQKRIIQLRFIRVAMLQPDPSNYLEMVKDLNFQTNKILVGIHPNDPYPGIELAKLAKMRAATEADIRAEHARIINETADQAVAAAELDDCQHRYALRQQIVDLPTQLRDQFTGATIQ